MLWTKFGSNFTFKFYIQNLLLQHFLWVYENYWYLWFIFLVFQKIKSQKTIPQEETPPKNKRLVLVLFKNRSLLYKIKKKLDIITASSFFCVINYLRIWLISNWYVIYYIGQSRQFYRGWWWHEQQWEWGWFLHHHQHCVHHTTQVQVLTAACSNREISWFKALSVLLLKTFHDMAFNWSIFTGTL